MLQMLMQATCCHAPTLHHTTLCPALLPPSLHVQRCWHPHTHTHPLSLMLPINIQLLLLCYCKEGAYDVCKSVAVLHAPFWSTQSCLQQQHMQCALAYNTHPSARQPHSPPHCGYTTNTYTHSCRLLSAYHSLVVEVLPLQWAQPAPTALAPPHTSSPNSTHRLHCLLHLCSHALHIRPQHCQVLHVRHGCCCC